MDMKQILLFVLLLVPVWTCHEHRCLNETRLREVAQKKLESRFRQPLDPSPTADPGSPLSCPVELYRQRQPLPGLRNRSLSPWRYVTVTDEDLFPPSYVKAECLCSGCIQVRGDGSVKQSFDFNSVEIKQSRVFLRRERCCGGDTYTLKPVSVDVAVGCTCARATSN
ncbi:interleukin-17C [Mugil cephalus]|uniref:interleukin-17C n=1 Tax=Mugil cephalus TaxID=48193 RepID=UPI001FB68ACD|nr:interleukin-17C [Mugil cephalus]